MLFIRKWRLNVAVAGALALVLVMTGGVLLFIFRPDGKSPSSPKRAEVSTTDSARGKKDPGAPTKSTATKNAPSPEAAAAIESGGCLPCFAGGVFMIAVPIVIYV